MLWFMLNITCSIMPSGEEKASLQYPNIQANRFKAFVFSYAFDTCFTFIQPLVIVIFLTAANIELPMASQYNATLVSACVLVI